MMNNNARPEKKQKRAQLERHFLSSVLADIDMGSFPGAVKYPGVSWRHFQDIRHQALWRAIQTLDLAMDMDKRVDILIAGSGHPHEYFNDNRGAIQDLYKQAEGLAWLEYQLTAAGVLPLVGGKVYVKELAEAYAAAAATDSFAQELGFITEADK